MDETKREKRLNLISFAESELYSDAVFTNNQAVNLKNMIPQSFFMIYDRKTNDEVGYFIDISTGGLLIIGQVPFEKNAEYQFKVDFSSIMKNDSQIQFDVRCAWINNNVDIECYISGFEFIKIDRKDIEIIKQLIDQYNTKD